MPDLATMAIVVDAAGARREIALTRDMLKTLANGGREAEVAFKSLGQGAGTASNALPALARSTTSTTQGVTHLRGALQLLAIQATGIPGPLGRIASSLGMIGAGSTVMVGVLAGIAAMSLAWRKFREDANAAAEAMKELHKMEGSFSPSAMTARSGTLQRQERALAGQLEAQQSFTMNLPGPFGVISDYVKMWQSSQTKEKLADVRERLATLDDAIAEFTRDLEGEADRALRFQTRGLQTEIWDRAAGIARARDWRNPNAGVNETQFAAIQKAALTFAIEADKARATYSDEALVAKLRILEVEKQTAIAAAENVAIDARKLTLAQQKAGFQQSLVNYGIGMAAQAAGPFGGMVSGVGQNLLQGNLWGAAAAGITGLVDGILGMGRASREAAEALRQQRIAQESWLDSQRAAAGTITTKEARIREINRVYDEKQEELRRLMNQFHIGSPEEAEFQKRLEESEVLRIILLGKEADAIDRINGAIRNAPSGFYVERYLRQIGYGSWEDPSRVTPRSIPIASTGPARGTGGGTTLDLRGSTFTIDGTSGPELFQSFVAVLRNKARSTGGASMPLSDALNVS
jgi:hypothetical protein